MNGYSFHRFKLQLSEFIRHGHGKHIAILQHEYGHFVKRTIYQNAEKQKIVLKSLIMLALQSARLKRRSADTERSLSPSVNDDACQFLSIEDAI
jgi:hypothetical protein